MVLLCTGVGRAADRPDALTLQNAEDLKVWRVYNDKHRNFTVHITWRESPDSLTAFIHQPDTTGWGVTHLPSEMSVPRSSGDYHGDIDRTVRFKADDDGQVGVTPTVRISYEIRKEENLNGQINVGATSYTPGAWIPLLFKNKNDLSAPPLDLGIRVSFSPGYVDKQGGFLLGVEDFEGYHIWRGIRPDGSDLVVIGELSKEEAFLGSRTGGSLVDSVYFYSVIPTLRDSLAWFSPYGAVECLGTKISLPLEDDQLMWYDCNAYNGYTYYYAVTTFDRNYSVQSGRQGLFKFDNCQPAEGVPYECQDQLYELPVEVDAQTDIKRVYAVPNPYRTGGSQLTQANYHNFPDGKIRFVNVPPNASMKIYSVAGDLVWEGEHHGLDGNVEWDVKNLGGNDVGSGVYIFKVESDNGDTVYGRLVIIR